MAADLSLSEVVASAACNAIVDLIDATSAGRLAIYGDTRAVTTDTALGAQTPDGPVGNCAHSDMTVFSFHPVKPITTGEGGMVVTDDPELAERCRSLRNLCFQAKKRFIHEEIGWNYRMTEMQSALGLAERDDRRSHLQGS